VRNNATKDLRLVVGVGAQFRIEVLELNLLAPKVFRKASKGRTLIFIAIFIIESICSALDILPAFDQVCLRFSMRFLTAVELFSSREPIVSTGRLHFQGKVDLMVYSFCSFPLCVVTRSARGQSHDSYKSL